MYYITMSLTDVVALKKKKYNNSVHGTDVTAQQCRILDRHTHMDCTFHGHMIKKFSARGQQHTLYKHFTVTLQRNVGGGGCLARVGVGGGWKPRANTGLQARV